MFSCQPLDTRLPLRGADTHLPVLASIMFKPRCLCSVRTCPSVNAAMPWWRRRGDQGLVVVVIVLPGGFRRDLWSFENVWHNVSPSVLLLSLPG